MMRKFVTFRYFVHNEMIMVMMMMMMTISAGRGRGDERYEATSHSPATTNGAIVGTVLLLPHLLVLQGSGVVHLFGALGVSVDVRL